MDKMRASFQFQQSAIYHYNIPRYYTTLGDIYVGTYNSETNDFGRNYRCRLDSSWVPTRTSRPDPPQLMQSSEIFHSFIGQVPGYSGHVPGDNQRFGKRYGAGTADPKQYIRGD